MKRPGILYFFLFAVNLTVIFSCNEPKDEVWPEIIINQPDANRFYSPGDTITLEADFSDDATLSFVKVALVDTYNHPILAPVSISPAASQYHLGAELVIDDASLKGGSYNLQFQASDGVNTTSKYVKVNIDEIDRELLYPVVVTSEGTNHVRILRTDSTGVFRSIYMYQGDYAASDVSNAFGLLFFSGKTMADLQAFSLAENKSLWSVPCEQSSTGHWFEMLAYYYPWLLVSQYDGYVRGYDRYGVQQFKSQPVANNFAEQVYMMQDYVIAGMKEYSTDNRQLAVFHVSGGKLLDLQPLDFLPVGFGKAGTNKVIVFGNEGSDGVIALYDFNESTLAVINRLKGETISSVDMMSDNVFYLSAGNELYRYTYLINSAFPLASGYENGKIVCENLSEQLYVASGSTLFLVNAQDGSADTSWQFNGEILDVHLLYNK